jgi:serine/threonine-protein kinase
MQGHEKYSIQKVFGEGSLRATYHALDRLHGTKISINTIVDDRTTMDAAPSLLARFHNELQAASRLTHPGIVSLHDYGESQGRVYVVTELTKGTAAGLPRIGSRVSSVGYRALRA